MEQANNILAFSDPIQGLVAGMQLTQIVPMLSILTEQMQLLSRRMERMQETTSQRLESGQNEDCWLDAKKAAKYMDVSKSTFDKYRYGTDVKITGYPLDGKILYKKSDLDTFVMLYDLKSRGIA